MADEQGDQDCAAKIKNEQELLLQSEVDGNNQRNLQTNSEGHTDCKVNDIGNQTEQDDGLEKEKDSGQNAGQNLVSNEFKVAIYDYAWHKPQSASGNGVAIPILNKSNNPEKMGPLGLVPKFSGINGNKGTFHSTAPHASIFSFHMLLREALKSSNSRYFDDEGLLEISQTFRIFLPTQLSPEFEMQDTYPIVDALYRRMEYRWRRTEKKLAYRTNMDLASTMKLVILNHLSGLTMLFNATDSSGFSQLNKKVLSEFFVDVCLIMDYYVCNSTRHFRMYFHDLCRDASRGMTVETRNALWRLVSINLIRGLQLVVRHPNRRELPLAYMMWKESYDAPLQPKPELTYAVEPRRIIFPGQARVEEIQRCYPYSCKLNRMLELVKKQQAKMRRRKNEFLKHELVKISSVQTNSNGDTGSSGVASSSRNQCGQRFDFSGSHNSPEVPAVNSADNFSLYKKHMKQRCSLRNLGKDRFTPQQLRLLYERSWRKGKMNDYYDSWSDIEDYSRTVKQRVSNEKVRRAHSDE